MEFRGVAQLQKALQKNIGLDAVKRVVKQNGAEMQERAQRNAPVDSGTLKRSIGMEMSDVGLTTTVAPTAEYAPFVEHGTRFMEAQPFMNPAFVAQKSQFKRDLDKLVK